MKIQFDRKHRRLAFWDEGCAFCTLFVNGEPLKVEATDDELRDNQDAWDAMISGRLRHYTEAELRAEDEYHAKRRREERS